jgi:hypothetical protein
MKNKTLATWLAFTCGPLGLHRFYLHGLSDTWGWVLPIPTALGLYGLDRLKTFGQDDHLSWLLIPMLGFTLAASGLTAIVYGLTATDKWNARFNAEAGPEAAPGRTSWLTIGAVIAAMLIGTASLMASLAFSFQRYFEYQVEEARKISQ